MKRKVAALEKVDADLPNLQHKIRNDPLSYQQDFQAQSWWAEACRWWKGIGSPC
jgi:protein SDA1